MKRTVTIAAYLLAFATSSHAAGLDRSNQNIDVIFETGNHLELSFGYIDPSVKGKSSPVFSGAGIGNVAETFSIFGLGLKYQFNDRISFAMIRDEPFGANVSYPGASDATALGGTGVTVKSNAITVLGRYEFNDTWSVHGGLRYQEVSANVKLGGRAFGALSGYEGSFKSDSGIGYVFGAAYEVPEIALRVALTYNSGIRHRLHTSETVLGLPFAAPSTTDVDTPETISLDFQTGIAKSTLIFGKIRYARYSNTTVRPAGFSGLTGNSLTDLEDGYDFEIGLGHSFNGKWSGTIAVGFSTVGEDDLVSPLGPTNGSRYISAGVKYDVNDRLALSGGLRYTVLGNALSAPGGIPVASFSGNHSLSVGLRMAIKF